MTQKPTTEQLREIMCVYGNTHPCYLAAAECLANREAQPVAYADPQAFRNFQGNAANKEWMWANPDTGLIALYTTPPAPVVNPEFTGAIAVPEAIITAPVEAMRCGPAASYVMGYNACRAAMLDGSGVLWSGFDPAKDSSDAIPDGWKLVPVWPTEDMLAAGRTLNDSQLNMTPRNRIEMVYRAMLAAAPDRN